MCEVVRLLHHWRVGELHFLELLCHELLVLSLHELLLHQVHGLCVRLHLRVHVSFSSLSGTGIAHDHVLHHICKGICANTVLLGSIRLASAACHDFVKHMTLKIF